MDDLKANVRTALQRHGEEQAAAKERASIWKGVVPWLQPLMLAFVLAVLAWVAAQIGDKKLP